MPADLRAELDCAIVRHHERYGAHDYKLLQDDPRFAPWIGTHRGYAGEKRLDRYVAELRGHQPKAMRKRRVGGEAEPEPQPLPSVIASITEAPSAGSTLMDLMSAGAAPISLQTLQADLGTTLARLRQALSAGVNEYGEIKNPRVYASLVGQQIATAKAAAELSRRFHEDASSEAMMQSLLHRVLRYVPDDPDVRAALKRDGNALFREFRGLPATGD